MSTTPLVLPPTEVFIAGKWGPGSDGEQFPVADPATGQVIAEVAAATPDDGLRALTAATEAGPDWAKTPARERAEVLRRAYELTIARGENLAALITAEMGKSLTEARAEVTYGAEFLRWFAEEAVRIDGRWGNTPEGNLRTVVSHRPVGPCLFITPWNFPLAMATRKTAPALAAGCTVVLKPAELTPLTTLAWTQIMVDAGLPAGVLNVVPTTRPSELVTPLLADLRLRKLSFTGSTNVGRALLRQAAAGVLRVSMELGGNAPFIVFDDADMETTLEAALGSKLRNIGQACTAANRFLVQRGIAPEFTHRLREALVAQRVGPGRDPATDLGPLITEQARERVHTKVLDAVAGGAKLECGGDLPNGPGWFYPATVVSGVTPEMALFTQETFGPVAPITVFDTEAEAITLANQTEHGLAAYLCTSDLDRAFRLGEQLEFGLIGLNKGVIGNAARPFGGVKASGVGREGGKEGIFEFLETTYLALPL